MFKVTTIGMDGYTGIGFAPNQHLHAFAFCPHATPLWLGSVVVGRRTCDREVAGSTPAAALFGQQPWASCSHLFAKQYNLVPCEGLHAKAPYCGSGIGSNEQGEYCRAVLKRFCQITKNRDRNHLLYFYF